MNMRVKLEEVCERGTSNLRQSDVEGKSGAYPIFGAAGYIGNVDFYHQSKPYVAVVMKKFMEPQGDFGEWNRQLEMEHLREETGIRIKWMTEYIYDNFDRFKLIFCCSDGTLYENFLHNIVELEVESTQNFIEKMRRNGEIVPDIDRHLIHIITSGMFSGIAEIVIHDMPREDAYTYVGQLQEFYMAGWEKLI